MFLMESKTAGSKLRSAAVGVSNLPLHGCAEVRKFTSNLRTCAPLFGVERQKDRSFQGLGSIFSQVVYFGLAQNAVIFFTLLACDCAFLDGLETVVAVCVGEAVGFGGTSGLVVVFKEDGTSLEDNVLEACEELEAVDDGEASEGAARVKI